MRLRSSLHRLYGERGAEGVRRVAAEPAPCTSPPCASGVADRHTCSGGWVSYGEASPWMLLGGAPPPHLLDGGKAVRVLLHYAKAKMG